MASATLGLPHTPGSGGSVSGTTPPGSPGGAAIAGSGVVGAGGSAAQMQAQLGEIQSLQEALRLLKKENWRLKAERMKKQMETSLTPLPKLKPFVVNAATGDAADAAAAANTLVDGQTASNCETLIKRSESLKQELISLAVPKIPDISRRKPAHEIDAHHSPLQQYYDRVDRLLRLHSESTQLRVDVTNELSTRAPGAQIDADFSSFPTPAFARAAAAASQDAASLERLVARIRLPGADVKAEPRKLVVSQGDFHKIHSVLAF